MRKTLKDFDEAWKYGVKLNLEDRDNLDKLLNKTLKDYGENNPVYKTLKEMSEVL